MFWRRGPTTEQKAEAVKEKRESNDELFNHFMLCRALSLQSQECYQEHGTDAAQCRRSMEEENLCWGKLLCPEAMDTFLVCMKTGSGLSECMGEAHSLGQCMQDAQALAKQRQQNVNPVDKKMDEACRQDRRALTVCLEEGGGFDPEGKCVPLQRKHALCVASFKCPQVKDKLFTCMQKVGMSPYGEGYLARMKEVNDFKAREKDSELKACLGDEVELESCLIDVAVKQWESYGIPTDEYQQVSKREKARRKEQGIE